MPHLSSTFLSALQYILRLLLTFWFYFFLQWKNKSICFNFFAISYYSMTFPYLSIFYYSSALYILARWSHFCFHLIHPYAIFTLSPLDFWLLFPIIIHYSSIISLTFSSHPFPTVFKCTTFSIFRISLCLFCITSNICGAEWAKDDFLNFNLHLFWNMLLTSAVLTSNTSFDSYNLTSALHWNYLH